MMQMKEISILTPTIALFYVPWLFIGVHKVQQLLVNKNKFYTIATVDDSIKLLLLWT